MKRTDTQTVRLEEAAKILGMSPMYLRDQLRDGKMREIGFATERNGRWRYTLYRDNIERLRNGEQITNSDVPADGR